MMRMLEALGLAMAVTAATAPAVLACDGGRVTSDSGQLTIATGPEPVTPQTPVLVPPAD